MNIPFNDLSRYDDRRIKAAVSRVVDRGWYLNGQETEAFETQFAAYNSLPSIVACSSGTDALEIALRVWGIGPEDEVIVPANTWVSDAEVVIRVGATPVFVDVNADTGEIDLEHLASCRTEKTQVLIAVHLYGNHQQIRPLRTLVGPDVKILEDYAHRVGVPVASRGNDIIGDAIAFSFYPTKNLGAIGDAGAVASIDHTFNEQARLIRDHGQPSRDTHHSVGATNRMDEIQAAVLLEKLNFLKDQIRRRSEIAEKYFISLKENEFLNPGMAFQQEGAFHLFVLDVPERSQFLKFLEEHGIGYGFHYPTALPDLSVFQPSQPCPAASKRASRMVSLPCFPELTDEEVDYICATIGRFRPV